MWEEKDLPRLGAMDFQEFQFDDNVQYSVNLEDDETFQDWCARRIQAWYRGRKTRKQFLKLRLAALLIQVRWRRALAVIHAQPDLNVNARKIQNAWKRFWYRKVFLYYKNLIDFRQRGTPVTLLRSINPAEAQLAEAAAGLHVRFRLGGSTFPPLIFYKIYTHRPVTDICSFAPRDYAEEKRPKPRVQIEEDFVIPEELLESFHLGEGRTVKRQELGWYLREDANGWRPIAERLFYEEDPVERYTSAKRMDFSHIPKVRREFLNKKRREKKINWMREMYNLHSSIMSTHIVEEGAEAQAEPAHKPRSREFGDEGSDPSAAAIDSDLVDEDEDEVAVLTWGTNLANLDFDDYYSDWVKQSCSNGSDTLVPLPTKEYNKKSTIDSFRSFERENFEREMVE